MEWADVMADPCLQDLPYKIELDEYGRVVMSPASNKHGRFQAALANILERQMPNGVVLTECSVATEKGTKVPDVVWCSAAFAEGHGDETPFSQAPEVCVEVISPSNSRAELGEKIELYLAAGAEEVWLVSETGITEYFDATGAVCQSKYGVSVVLS